MLLSRIQHYYFNARTTTTRLYYKLPTSLYSFQNTHELLQQLKQRNIKIGIITNGFTEFQMSNLRALHIHTYTNTILVSEAEGIKNLILKFSNVLCKD